MQRQSLFHLRINLVVEGGVSCSKVDCTSFNIIQPKTVRNERINAFSLTAD